MSSAFIDKAISTHGKLDAIWANAGISGGLVPLAEQTVEHWQEILRINLIGAFLAVKSQAHLVKQGHGAILCTASVAGLKSGASGHPYAASKAGVISLVQTTALFAFRHRGADQRRVPGLIETGMTKPVFDRAKERGTQDKIGQLNPLKRAGQPHELAAMGLFLLSDEASYVNGQAFPVDGGLTASMPYAGKPIYSFGPTFACIGGLHLRLVLDHASERSNQFVVAKGLDCFITSLPSARVAQDAETRLGNITFSPARAPEFCNSSLGVEGTGNAGRQCTRSLVRKSKKHTS